MGTAVTQVEQRTGLVYGDLWHKYDDAQFTHSVSLLQKRWLANGEPEDFFVGKRVLDVGCGGGRYSVAMALMGAASVTGVDVSSTGVADARRRVTALGLHQITLGLGSVLDLPFEDGEFDFVLCSGILQHTPSIERGLSELYRVVKPGGSVYLLVYGSGGLWWPLNWAMRPPAEVLGVREVERCIDVAGLQANKRRTILDALYCPIFETYTTERVDCLLGDAGFVRWRRWEKARLDHEESPATLIAELATYERLWLAGADSASDSGYEAVERALADTARSAVELGRALVAQHEAGRLSARALRDAVVGPGHHRIIAERA